MRDFYVAVLQKTKQKWGHMESHELGITTYQIVQGSVDILCPHCWPGMTGLQSVGYKLVSMIEEGKYGKMAWFSEVMQV